MTDKKLHTETQSISVKLLKFSMPLILSGILQQLYNWADAFVVGNVNGELALAAVGSTSSVINFYVLAITGFTLGLSILFAQKFGSGNTEDYPRILSTFSCILGAVFLVLSAAGICLTPQLLNLMNTTQDTLELAEDYCSRPKFLSKIFKINVKNILVIFSDFTHEKRTVIL